MAVDYEHMPLVFFYAQSIHLDWGFCFPITYCLWLSCLYGIRHILESVVEHLVCLLLQFKIVLHRRDQPPPPSCLSQFANVSCIVEARSEIKSEEKNISTSHSAIEAHEKATLVRKNKLLLSEVKENTENLSAEVGFEPTYRRDNDHVSISLFRPFRWSPGSLVPLPRKHQQPVLRPNFKHRSSMLNTILLHHSR